jgi:hypothetical protein
VDDAVPGLLRIGGQQDMRRPRLRGEAEQRRLQIIVAWQRGHLGDTTRVEPRDPAQAIWLPTRSSPGSAPASGTTISASWPVSRRTCAIVSSVVISPSASTTRRESGCSFSAASTALRTVSTTTPRCAIRAIAPSSSGVRRATTMMICAAPAAISSRA